MSALKTLKDAVKVRLDALVTAGTLKGASEVDFRKDPLASDVPGYPWAFLMPPATESEQADNRTILRKYTFGIMVVHKLANLATPEALEDLIEAVVNEFDNHPTLGGASDGAIEPVSSAPEPYQQNNKELVFFIVAIKAGKTYTQTY